LACASRRVLEREKVLDEGAEGGIERARQTRKAEEGLNIV
jgi:hypothetical protein